MSLPPAEGDILVSMLYAAVIVGTTVFSVWFLWIAKPVTLSTISSVIVRLSKHFKRK